jgi:hypothetical protein
MSTSQQTDSIFDPRKFIKSLVDDQHVKFSEEIYRDLLKQSVTRLTQKDVQEAHKRLLKKAKESPSKATPNLTSNAPTTHEDSKKNQPPSKS